MSDTEPTTLRVLRGAPSAEDLAAVTALVAAAGAGAHPAAPAPQRGRWNDPAWQLRTPLTAGAGSWQASART